VINYEQPPLVLLLSLHRWLIEDIALGNGKTILPNARVLRCVHVLDSRSLSSDHTGSRT
jgi:hypothetical protein